MPAAAVIGVPSGEWGEDIVAVVVLRPGQQAAAGELAPPPGSFAPPPSPAG